ncbi:MAG: hypothetical protein AAF125_08990, partial [Chloroflexota bacterium]
MHRILLGLTRTGFRMLFRNPNQHVNVVWHHHPGVEYNVIEVHRDVTEAPRLDFVTDASDDNVLRETLLEHKVV